MRFLISVLLMAVCAAAAEYFFPWWSVAIVCFVAALMAGLQPGSAFRAGFVSIALLWLAVAMFRDIPNQHILSSRMAALLFKSPGYYPLLIIVSVIPGALAGGLAAWSGALLRGPRQAIKSR